MKRLVGKMFNLRVVFCALFVFSFLVFVPRVLAVEEGSLGAYPTNYDPSNPKTKSWFIYELKPGVTKEDSITVVNNTERTLSVKVYPVDATTTGDGAFALLNEDQRQNEVGSWVNMAKDTITLQPRDRKEVPFTIAIPKYATVGDHAGGIIVQEVKKANDVTQGMGLNIVSRVGTRIYETVPGAQLLSLDVRDLGYKIIDNHLVFTFTLENQGNVILTPTGNLDVKDASGKIFETIPLGNLGSVFPGKPTVLTAKSVKSAPWFGQYSALVTVNYSPTKAIAKSMQFFIYIKDWKVALPVPFVLFIIVFFFQFKKWFSMSRVKKILQAPSVGVQVQPAYAPVAAQNIDQLFVARHIKLLVVLFSVSTVVLSSLFAFILQQFISPRVVTQAEAQASPSQVNHGVAPLIPTVFPTATLIPVAPSEMKVSVLNGSGKTGQAKVVAAKLIKEGYTVIKTDNAPQSATQTLIQYPEGKVEAADKLMEALKPEYTHVKEEATSDSSVFTITLGL